jgi:hypothetical protein
VALFGRKINHAEHQLAFIEMLRLVTDGKLSPEEAVRAYHGVLQALKINPRLPLEKDLALTDQTMSYAGNSSRSTITKPECPGTPIPAPAPKPAADTPATSESSTPPRSANDSSEPTSTAWPRKANGSPDFANMTSAHRRAYDLARLTKRFG